MITLDAFTAQMRDKDSNKSLIDFLYAIAPDEMKNWEDKYEKEKGSLKWAHDFSKFLRGADEIIKEYAKRRGYD